MAEPHVALVTGAGKGIGRAVAQAFAREGLSLVLAARTEREIAVAAREAEGSGAPEALAVVTDIRSDADVRAVSELIASRWGKLDVLVNNAGFAPFLPFEETDPETWETALAVNLTGPYRILRETLPLLRAAGSSHVFQILSMAVRRAFPNLSAYTASKSGLLGLTNALREELRPHGIKMTAVLPGAVDTPLWDTVQGEWDRARMLSPEDVAHAVLSAWRESDRSLTEEIVLGPAGGDL